MQIGQLLLVSKETHFARKLSPAPLDSSLVPRDKYNPPPGTGVCAAGSGYVNGPDMARFAHQQVRFTKQMPRYTDAFSDAARAPFPAIRRYRCIPREAHYDGQVFYFEAVFAAGWKPDTFRVGQIRSVVK